MKETYQKQLKSVLETAKALQDEVGTRDPTEAESKKLMELSNQANSLKQQIDSADVLDSVKNWSNRSAGSDVAAAEFARESLPGEGDIPGVSADPNSGEMFAVDGEFKSSGQKRLDALKGGAYKDAFATYIRNTGLGKNMKGESMKILSEGSDTAGGFWIPPDFRPDLVKKIAAMSSVRPNASIYTTGTDHITFPAVTHASTSADDPYAERFTSGVRFAWRGSMGAAADYAEATNPIAGQISIPVNLATAAIVMTREQLEDTAFDILGYITQLGAEAFALGEESAYTNGSGAGQPRGFLQHPSLAILFSTYATVGGVTYMGQAVTSGTTTIAFGNATTGILGLEALTPPQYEANAKWYAAKATYAGIRGINAGTATLPQWSFGESWPNYSNNYSAALLGYPVVKNQFVDATLATAHYYLAFGDMKGYYVVDRVGLSVEVFREVYGLRDQVVVYMRKRTGGDLVHPWKMHVLYST